MVANWSDLPVNVKEMCVDKMSFRARWNFRQTSRAEKYLVEGRKCEVTELAVVKIGETRWKFSKENQYVWSNDVTGYERREKIRRDASLNQDDSLQQPEDSKDELIVLTPSSRLYLNVNEKTLDTVRDVIRSVLKMGQFPKFEWTEEKPVSELIQQVATEVPIATKQFSFKNLPILDFSILDNCRGLELVDVILREKDMTSFQELWTHWKPHFPLCNFSVKNVDSMDVSEVSQLIQKVIDSDPKLDSRFEVGVLSHLSVSAIENAIKQKFGNVVSVWDKSELRIALGEKSVAVTYTPGGISIAVKLTPKGRNWCDMPIDVKRLCIERMDLGTRWFLRYTGQDEKRLVEEFKRGTFDYEMNGIYNTDKCRMIVSAPSLQLKMLFDPSTFETARSITRTLRKMGNFGSFYCGNDELFKEVISEIPEDTMLPVTAVDLQSASRTDLYNMRKCRMHDRVNVELRPEDRITFADVWAFWEPLLPFGEFELKNVYSIEAEEVINLLEKIIVSDPNAWARFSVRLLTPFGQRDDVEARLRSIFGNRLSISDFDEITINLGRKIFSVDCGPQEICISCHNGRSF